MKNQSDLMDQMMDSLLLFYDTSIVNRIYQSTAPIRHSRENNQVIKMCFPRVSGNTSSAMNLLLQHDSSIILTFGRQVSGLREKYPTMFDRIGLLSDHLVQSDLVINKLSGKKMDFVLIDSISINYDELHHLFDRYDPKFVVFVGDSKLIRYK